MTTHDPTPHNMAMIMIYKEDLHYLQRAGRRAKKKEIDLLHDIIEKHRRPGAAAREEGRQPPDRSNEGGQIAALTDREGGYMVDHEMIKGALHKRNTGSG